MSYNSDIVINKQLDNIFNTIININKEYNELENYDELEKYKNYVYATNNRLFVFYAFGKTIEHLLLEPDYNGVNNFNDLEDNQKEEIKKKAMEILFGANFNGNELTNKNETISNIRRINYSINGQSDCLIQLYRNNIIDYEESENNNELNILRGNPLEYEERYIVSSIMYNNPWINRNEAIEIYRSVMNRISISHFSASQKIVNKVNKQLSKIEKGMISWNNKNSIPIVAKNHCMKIINKYFAMEKNKDKAINFVNKVFQVYYTFLENLTKPITYEQTIDLFLTSINLVYNDNREKYNIRTIKKFIIDIYNTILMLKKYTQILQDSTKYINNKKVEEFNKKAKTIAYENATNNKMKQLTLTNYDGQQKQSDKNEKFENKGEIILKKSIKKINNETSESYKSEYNEPEYNESEYNEIENSELKIANKNKTNQITAFFATSIILNKIKKFFNNIFKSIIITNRLVLEEALLEPISINLNQHDNSQNNQLSLH